MTALGRVFGVAAVCAAALATGGCPDPDLDLFEDYHGTPQWYDVEGVWCGQGLPSPRCNYFLNGDKIFAYEDPYYTADAWDLGIRYDTWDYVDSYGTHSTFEGFAWLSPSGILYDEWGFALN